MHIKSAIVYSLCGRINSYFMASELVVTSTSPDFSIEKEVRFCVADFCGCFVVFFVFWHVVTHTRLSCSTLLYGKKCKSYIILSAVIEQEERK